MSAGVLNQEQVLSLINSDPPGVNSTSKILEVPDPSAIDLPLGTRYFEMRGSCRPGHDHTVSSLIRNYGIGEEMLLKEDTKLERGKIYLIELAWSLELPPQVYARSTARSSIGRLDALVRLVADHQPEFDRVARNSRNVNLYVEVVPITFDLLVRPGLALSQIRFIRGKEDLCIVPASALDFEDEPYLVNLDGTAAEYKTADGDDRAVLLSLELAPDPVLGFSGFVAKNQDHPAIDPSKGGHYNPADFWEPVEVNENSVTVEKDRFYIFRSKERFRIPGHMAVDCQAYSESLGDIRIHYAGFAHPYFGYDRKEGTPLIFEVRGHNLNTILRGGDALAKVYFLRMSHKAKPDEKGQGYNTQELKLSACFGEWTPQARPSQNVAVAVSSDPTHQGPKSSS